MIKNILSFYSFTEKNIMKEKDVAFRSQIVLIDVEVKVTGWVK